MKADTAVRLTCSYINISCNLVVAGYIGFYIITAEKF